ncbi:M16 family metallopeptidase [Sphingomicrobium nitratireducens]|uniref:M16 family metallopeptidase n=1 Tax=Sphingomicrobium nitratireducens TaxID=2964666 RepID=UPI00223FB20F|nr:pitrilysin family protein [Sphingomicrobium nitratireducens]
MRLNLLAAVSTVAIALAAPMPAAAETAMTAAQVAQLEVPPLTYEERVLDNGLKVVAIQDETTPNVYVSMWYDVGSKHDPAGKSGFAHLFEHILSRKTVNIPYGDISRMVDDVGGSRNASTWFDRTNYFELVPAEYLEQMLWTHAERMARPVIDEDVFKAERNIVQEEYRQRNMAPPYGRLILALVENVYNTHPYRRPAIGSLEDINSSTLADARAFHEAFYGPDTATLIVAGNFDKAQLDALVDKYFADIPRRANPMSLEITNEDTPLEARRITVTAPNVPLPMVVRAWRTPPVTVENGAALELLDTILSAGDNNRFDPALVKTGIATSAGTGIIEAEHGGIFYASATAAGGQEIETVEKALDETIERFRREGPTEAEMAEARNTILSYRLSLRETVAGRANEIGEALVQSGDAEFANKRLAAILSATPADVQAAARSLMGPEHRLDMRYVQGEGDVKEFANPVPLPTFSTPPAAQLPELALKPEGERDPIPGPGEAPNVPLPELERATLSNGITMYAGETGNVPIATIGIAFKGGSALDGAAKAGRAALAASIAEKGTPTRSAEQIAAALESLGATISSSSGNDGSYLFVTAPTATLEEATMIAADIVKNASYPEEEFERERKRTIDGLKVQYNNPGAIAGTLVGPVLYGDAPYAVTSAGTPETVASLTRQDMIDFREAFWRPSNATIVASGGIDAGTAQAIAEKAFGDWQVAGSAPAFPADLDGTMQPRRTLVIDMPGVGQAAVYAVARGMTANDPRRYAAELTNAELGGSGTARLYNEIRAKRALSYGAYSSVALRQGEGYIFGGAQTKNESAAEVAKILLEEFAKIGSEGVSEDVLDRRRTLLTGRFERGLQSSGGFASTVLGAVLDGMSPEEALTYAEKIDSADAATAPATLAGFIDPARVSLIIVGDAEKFIEPLKALRPETEVISIEDIDFLTGKPKG